MTLGALAGYAVAAGYRHQAILRYVKHKVKKGRKVETTEHIALPVAIGQCPPEPSFAKFGIIVPLIIDLSSKILDTRLLVKTNVWMRNRIFFGCNWRADIYTALGCGNETALRIRKNFALFERDAFSMREDL